MFKRDFSLRCNKSILFSYYFIFILITTIIISTISSFAGDNAQINPNLDNISAKYAECAAYFDLVSDTIMNNAKKQEDIETAKKYKDLAKYSLLYAVLLAKQGRAEEVALEVTRSRHGMFTNQMRKEAYNRAENISILINKYNESCIYIMNNPPLELLKIIEKESKKQ